MNPQNSQNDKKDITLNSAGLSLFNGDNYFYHVFKKTQKILSATYLITDFILDTDPIKYSIRDSGIALYKSAAEMSISASPNRKAVLDKFFNCGLSLISFCQVASQAGLMSVMNYEIMSEEIRLLMQVVENREVPHKLGRSFVINRDMLQTESFQTRSDYSINGGQGSNNDNNHRGESNRNSNRFLNKNKHGQQDKDINKYSTPKYFNQTGSTNSHNTANNLSHSLKQNNVKNDIKNDNSRTQKIVDLIKMKGEVSIKDISDSFLECSEKTIQRELISLVSSGVLNKVGERRWSRYSIKN